jgi:hypothetical protein
MTLPATSTKNQQRIRHYFFNDVLSWKRRTLHSPPTILPSCLARAHSAFWRNSGGCRSGFGTAGIAYTPSQIIAGTVRLYMVEVGSGDALTRNP